MRRANIALSLLPLQTPSSRQRGIGVYTRNLAIALHKAGLLSCGLLDPNSAALLPNDQLALKELPLQTASAALWHELSQQDTPPMFLATTLFDLEQGLHTTLPLYVRDSGLAFAVMLYDLIPLKEQETYLSYARHYQHYQLRLNILRSASLVFTLSEKVRQEAIALLKVPPEKVQVVGSGVDAVFHQHEYVSKTALCRSLGIKNNYLLSVCGERRKNPETILKAFAALPTELRATHSLVILGYHHQPQEAQRLYALATSLDFAQNQLCLPDYVDAQKLPSLYAHAAICLFASSNEGLGLPPLEAAACGCPTILSEATPLAEELNCPQFLFRPHDHQQLATHVRSLLQNSALRSELCTHWKTLSAKYTWDHCVARLQNATKAMHEVTHRPARQNKPRLAFITPLPPSFTGIAKASYSALAALQEHFELQVLYTSTTGRRPEIPVDCRIAPLESLGRTIDPFAFDELLYSIGNSSHHVRSINMLQRYPGIVWLHDIMLHGLYWEDLGGDTAAFRQLLQEAGADTRDTALQGHSLYEYVEQKKYSCAHRVLSAARALVLHSEHAHTMLRYHTAECSIPPVFIHPLPFPELRPKTQSADSVQLLASFGILHRRKEGPKIIRALALLIKTHPHTRLVFVGAPSSDCYKQELLQLADNLGVAENIEITGRVDEQTYDTWLRRADIAIQARADSFGESSLGVNECLAVGTPVITTLSPCAEWPKNSVCYLEKDATPQQFAEAIAQMCDKKQLLHYRDGGYAFAAKYTANSFAKQIAEIVYQSSRHARSNVTAQIRPSAYAR